MQTSLVNTFRDSTLWVGPGFWLKDIWPTDIWPTWCFINRTMTTRYVRNSCKVKVFIHLWNEMKQNFIKSKRLTSFFRKNIVKFRLNTGRNLPYLGVLALPTNIRLGWKRLTATNALAYYRRETLAAVKSFIKQANTWV